MIVTNKIIKELFGIELTFDLKSDHLALVDSTTPGTLSFIDDSRFVTNLNRNENIEFVFVTQELADKIDGSKKVIIADDPRYVFFTLLNFLGSASYKKTAPAIHESAVIHPTAFVAEYNVKIGAGTVVEPNVTILPDVEIGKNCIVRAGSVIGCEGFEQKRTKKGILAVLHFGKVVIGDDVQIGALNSIAKGMVYRETLVGDFTRTDSLVHIAHGVHIGKRCLVTASCVIAGSVDICDDVWIGPNASISSGTALGKGSFVTIGSVVVKDVPELEVVTGNFALPHPKFLRNWYNLNR